MEKNDILEYLASSPDVLLDIAGEILKRYRDVIDQQDITDSQKQLVEISKTIDRLENTGTSVPDELRNLKSSLITLSNDSKQAKVKYETLIKGLSDLCSEYKLNGHSKPKGRKSITNDSSPARQGRLTPRNTLIRAIVKVMEEMGKSGHKREIHNRLEDFLVDVLNSEDYKIDSSGQVSWHHQADWARMYMVQVGILKKDSPRGIWELSMDYKKIMDRLK